MSMQGVDYEARCMRLEQNVLRQIAIAAEFKTENERLRAEVNLLKEDRIKVVAAQRETIIEYKSRIEAALSAIDVGRSDKSIAAILKGEKP